MNKKIRYNVEKLYYDDYRVCEDGKEEGLNIYQNNFGKLEGGRQHDPIYNDENARRQILSLIHISEPRDRQKSRMPSSA